MLSYSQLLADRLDPPPPPDPVRAFTAMGMRPDPWQIDLLRDRARHIAIRASRQSGKSQCVGVKVMHTAKVTPRAMILLGSPSQRQSAELLAKALECHYLGIQGDAEVTSFTAWQGERRESVAPSSALDYLADLTEKAKERERQGKYDAEVESQSRLEMRLSNRSRIVAVPGRSGATVRSFSSVTLLVIDEAAFAQVEFYQAVFPMLAVSRGQIILLSTPHAKEGPFFDICTDTPDWEDGKPDAEQESAWRKYVIPWQLCPRITPAFIEAERGRYGVHYVEREYEVKFSDMEWRVFRTEDIAGMARPDVENWNDQWSDLWK